MRLTRSQRVLLVGPLVLVMGPWLILPALLGLAATLTSYAPTQPTVDWVGFRTFGLILGDRTFAAAARNVVVFTVLVVPLEVVVGFGLAYVLRKPFRGRAAVRLILLLPWLVSPVASGVMWHFLLDSQTGFLDFIGRSLGLASVPSPLSQHVLALPTVILVESWRLAPLVAFLVGPGLSAIPAARWEDARLDGLSTWATIRNVAVPALRPLILAVVMLLVGGALATFDSVLTMTGGGPGTETITPALYSYGKAFTFSNWPVGAASGWLIGGAVLVVGLVYVRLATRTDA